MKGRGLRLMVWDDTCRGQGGTFPLTATWVAGYGLYKLLGRIDAAIGVTSWADGLRFLADHEPDQPIAEIQFWGHGKWGEARVAHEVLDVTALEVGHPHHELLCAIRARLVGPEALWWFRTCETFGAERGHQFAQAWSSFFGCRAAGHTFIIGPWQSGLHQVSPGQAPSWSTEEGLAPGSTTSAPSQALWSGPRQPNTITCLRGTIPEHFG